jgi:hypothetical protein
MAWGCANRVSTGMGKRFAMLRASLAPGLKVKGFLAFDLKVKKCQ